MIFATDPGCPGGALWVKRIPSSDGLCAHSHRGTIVPLTSWRRTSFPISGKVDAGGAAKSKTLHVNALDGAISKALLPVFPTLNDMHLVDYKVRVVNAREGTAARVRVVIECRDKTDVWGTVGVSENIIEASWLALSDAIEYKLFKDKS